jgi:hypothetical protein
LAQIGSDRSRTVTAADTWQRLAAEGLVSGERPGDPVPHAPWYVRLMLGLAGWLAAFMLLGFFAAAMSFIFENESVMILAGLVLLALAWLLLNWMARTDFAAQFGLAISFAGQCLASFGFFQALGSEGGDVAPWAAVAGMQFVLLLVMPGAIHRAWSAAALVLSGWMALGGLGAAMLGPALILAPIATAWLGPGHLAMRHAAVRTVTAGAIAALLVMDLVSGLTGAMSGLAVQGTPFGPLAVGVVPAWTEAVLVGAVMAWVVFRLMTISGMGKAGVRYGALASVAAVVVLTMGAPGVATGLCVMLIGFGRGSRWMTAAGALALLCYLSSWYYQLDISLLAKSQILVGLGAFLLGLRWILARIA